MGDIYGTGEPIKAGSQVVVEGHGMGTVTSVGCPVFKHSAGPAFHVRIEGDSEDICFQADIVRLYADVYAESGEPVNADGLTENETIDMAEAEISAAQYRALHDRLEDFTVWLVEMGYLAPKAVHGDLDRKSALNHPDAQSNLFEMIEGYLEQATEHEDTSPLSQILQPDMSEDI